MINNLKFQNSIDLYRNIKIKALNKLNSQKIMVRIKQNNQNRQNLVCDATKVTRGAKYSTTSCTR